MLFVIHSLRGGGAGRVCVTLANGLAGRGRQVTVAVNSDLGDSWTDAFDAAVSVVPLGARHARRSVRPLVELIENRAPAVVMAFNYQLAIALLAVRRRVRRRGRVAPFRIVSRNIIALTEAARMKGFWQREVVTRIVRRYYRRLDAVVAQSEGMRDDIVTNFAVPQDRVIVIHNPVHPPRSGADRAPQPSPTDRGPVVLYAGRFKPQKQPLLLLDLIERIRQRRTDARLVAAGDGPLVARFLAEVERRGLSDAVDYRGYVRDTAALFSEAAVTVLVSAYEGFPNVLVESLAAGVPVAGFDCPTGPAEIIRDGENGALVPPGALESLAAACVRLIDDPPPATRVVASAEPFRLERVLDRYEAVLRGRSE